MNELHVQLMVVEHEEKRDAKKMTDGDFASVNLTYTPPVVRSKLKKISLFDCPDIDEILDDVMEFIETKLGGVK